VEIRVLTPTFGNLAAGSTVLCIGAHCDDIEIGCGATLRRIARDNPACRIVWAIFAGNETREHESRAAAQALLGEQRAQLQFMKFRESHFPSQFDAVKAAMESLKGLQPSVVFTHYLHDRHQDHKLLAELTWNTFRNHLVLEYEIPKFEGDLGAPNVFFEASHEDTEHKINMLMSCFASQLSRSWFTPDTFRALLRIRGIECVAGSGYAEAFHGRKLRF
jgi:LmbE family N-acetylglucosaminyl deacetylase